MSNFQTAATNLVFVKGRVIITTTDVAEEAGVNRTLINYYFRSLDNLLE